VITIYSKNACAYCLQAKNLLTSKGIVFNEVRIDEDHAAREFVLSQGHRTVPQIYQNDELLVSGGFTGLAAQSAEWWETLRDNHVTQ
jgi:glutaredoxin 3